MSILMACCCSTTGRAVVNFAQVGHRGGLISALHLDFVGGLLEKDLLV